MPGATVSLKNVGTNQVRETVTGTDGVFTFPDLLAGTYDLSVSVQGFKTYEQKGIVLGATERVALRQIVLEVGQLSEQVTVQAEATLVQTNNGARSGLITRENLDDIALKGRDFAGMLKILPGVVDTSAREAPGWGSMQNLSINGRGSFNFSYDGVTNKDTGSNSGNYAAPALDSIAEVRVQASNFQAEYGRSSGATISVITRSGTKDFRGTAAFYKRDDAWNGNEYQRRENCRTSGTQCDPPLYTFDNTAWTLGGPVLIPGTEFNRSRNRLFFFWSQDILSRTDPGNLNTRRMPTALERQGDFSQTFDTQGRLIFIRDPQLSGNCNSVTGGPACFPGNRIPAGRINPTAQALLNLFPQPNAVDPNGLYNYTFQTVQDWPRNDQVLRMDWNVGPDTTFYGRLQFGYEKRAGGVSFLGSTGAGWPQQPSKYEIDTVSYVNTLLHTFNSTTFAEFTVGVNWSHQYTSALDQAAIDNNDRTQVLPGLTQYFPSANPDNLMPQASFNGGIPSSNAVPIASFNVESRWPFFGYNELWNFSGNVTKIKGAHTMKAGLFVEHTTRPAQRSSQFNGNLIFNTDSQAPLNTNVGFANALIGAVTQYSESDGHPSAHGQFINTEFYVQDNWRLRRNFTLDVGVRFYYITPTQSEGDEIAAFNPNTWNASQAPTLFRPVSTPQGRRALNPLTNEIFPAVYIGRLVPNSGDFINGMEVFEGTPQQHSPFKVAPRFNFAWDPWDDGKTSIRGGWGVFYDRYQDDWILDLIELPPVLNTYNLFYTTLPELLNNPLTATPTGVRFIDDFTPPVVYNWSVGVQRDIGFQLVGDVAYVGNAGRNQQLINNAVNGRPYGYAYQPSSLDPTVVSGGQAQPLPDDLLRPYQGYGAIAQRMFNGYSDYHALQVAVNRRRAADGLSFGVAYTYSQSKGLQAYDPFVSDNHARNYARNGTRPHNLVINYTYEVPNLSQKWDNIVVKALADNWQVSGITSILSGTKQGFSYSFTGVPTGTLAGTGAINGGASRPNIVCDPNIPRDQRTFNVQFDTSCIQPPTDPNRLGDALGDEYQGPGYMNWDISFFKHVPMGGNRRLQFRVELYNAFNTDQWTGTDTSAVFNYVTGAQTDANFGKLTGATLSARRIQLGVRFVF
jgi:hypothetical protein